MLRGWHSARDHHIRMKRTSVHAVQLKLATPFLIVPSTASLPLASLFCQEKGSINLAQIGINGTVDATKTVIVSLGLLKVEFVQL